MRFKADRCYGHKKNCSGINLVRLTRGASGTCKLGALKGVLKI